MIHTQSGSYTYEEITKRDNEVMQKFLDYWEGKIDVFALHDFKEKMLKQRKITIGELESLQYQASRIYDKKHNIKY